MRSIRPKIKNVCFPCPINIECFNYNLFQEIFSPVLPDCCESPGAKIAFIPDKPGCVKEPNETLADDLPNDQGEERDAGSEESNAHEDDTVEGQVGDIGESAP